jgi:sterol desaturase/sphingolipid hydroxylase (fatty acid hydroxylase superfamily)
MLKPVISALVALWPVALAAAVAALAERYWPWCKQLTDWLRWLHASVLFALGSVASELVLPIGLTGVALFAVERHWGLLNYLSVPTWITFVLGILIIDFVLWGCHWTMHRSQVVWRIHRVHHSDEVLDTSTAFRFHPAEILYKFFVQAIAIFIIGIPASAVVVFGTLMLFFNVWEHANVKTSRALRALSVLIVTPDFHRIHHSAEARHQSSNLGALFTIWDQIFGSFVPLSELDENSTFRFGLGANPLTFSTLTDVLVDPLRNGEIAEDSGSKAKI